MTADSNTSPKRRLGLSWKMMTLAVALLIIGGLMFRAHQLGQKAEIEGVALLNQLRAAGEPTTMAELARIHASFATNGNAAGLFDDIFAIQPEKMPFKLDRKISGSPQPGTRPDDVKLSPGEVMPEELAIQYREFVRTNATYFAAVDRIKDGPRYAVQPLDFNAGAHMILPHISKFKQTAVLLQARCYLNIHERNVDAALHDMELIMRVSEALAPEQLLICFLVRQACSSIGLTSAERLLNHVELTDEQLVRLQQVFRKFPDQAEMRAALVGERTFGLQAFDVPPGIAMLPLAARRGSSGWHADRLLYLQSMARLIEASTMPVPDGLRAAASLEKDIMNLVQPSKNQFWNWFNMAVRRRFIITVNFIPSVGTAIAKAGSGLARVRLLETATEIERFKLKNGRLPESLDELRSSTAPAQHRDPFTGKDLIYRKTETGYLVYSIGPDLNDNNGTKEKGTIKGRANEDIVFTVSTVNRVKAR